MSGIMVVLNTGQREPTEETMRVKQELETPAQTPGKRYPPKLLYNLCGVKEMRCWSEILGELPWFLFTDSHKTIGDYSD